MGDVFVETSVKRELTTPEKVMQVFLYALTVVFFVAFILKGYFVTLISFVVFLVISIIFTANSKVEFDYTLVNHELEITKISNGSRRKTVCDIDLGQEMIAVALPGDDLVRPFEQKKVKVVDCGSHTGEKCYELAMQNKDTGEEKIIVFEPDNKMLEALWRTQPRKVAYKA